MVNKYLYNGASEYNATAGWYETMFRGYDPVLGRMNGVDVMAGRYGSVTPYNFSFNNPAVFSDPSGASPLYSETELILFGNNYRGGRPVIKDSGTYGGFGKFGDHITPGSGGNWSDGNQFSDWSPNGGSAMYNAGRAAGLTDIGGQLYGFNSQGGLMPYTESGGQLGYWGTRKDRNQGGL